MKMKKLFTALFLTASLLLCAVPSFAFSVKPGYVYQAAKLVYPVTFDGKESAGEWDDANALIVNADNQIFKDYGRWQGGSSPRTAAELSVTYKIKWDESCLYILELRTDNNYYPSSDGALAPWTGDGTLLFLAYDNGNPVWANAYEPFWVTQMPGGKAEVALRAWIDGNFGSVNSADYIGNWKYAGGVSSSLYTMEIAIPWTDIKTMGDIPAVAEGLEFYFTPIISNSDADYANWDQLNFHDRGNRSDAVVDETTNPAELPKNWAGLVLSAAIIAPETEAPAADTGAAPTAGTSAAQTGDAAAFFAAVAVFAAAVYVFTKKKSGR